MPLPVILGVLIWGAVGGVIGFGVGAAIDFLLMEDEDVQQTADWLRMHGHARILNAYIRLVGFRSHVRRTFGLVTPESARKGESYVVRESTLRWEEIPEDVREILKQGQESCVEVTSEVMEALGY